VGQYVFLVLAALMNSEKSPPVLCFHYTKTARFCGGRTLTNGQDGTKHVTSQMCSGISVRLGVLFTPLALFFVMC
jgi:hypothetical protein